MLRFLANLGDHRVARHSGKQAVDVDPAKAASDGDMLLRGQLRVAEEHEPVYGAVNLLTESCTRRFISSRKFSYSSCP